MKIYQVFVTYNKPARGRWVYFKKEKVAEKFKSTLEKNDKDGQIKKIYINEIKVYDQIKILKDDGKD